MLRDSGGGGPIGTGPHPDDGLDRPLRFSQGYGRVPPI
jgi:hypothetical protein